MSRNVYVSGRLDIYEAIRMLETVRKQLQIGTEEWKLVDTAIHKLYRGQYLNEEQLKAMYYLGYLDPPTTGWLEDDFDD